MLKRTLKKVLELCDKQDLAKELGVSYMTITRWSNGPQEPTVSQFDAMIKHYNSRFGSAINISNNINVKTQEFIQSSVNPNTINDKLSIPYYGNVPVSAGGGSVILSEEPTKMIEVPRRLIKRILTTEKPMTFPVTGDSMEPSFKNGDVVVAGVSPDYPCDGVYVIRYEDTMYIKRLMKSKVGYLLISDNKLYNDMTVTKSDDFAIIGRVIQVLHNVQSD